MAQNLMKKGHNLVVYDLVKPAMEKAEAAGAIRAEKPSQVSLDELAIASFLRYLSCN